MYKYLLLFLPFLSFSQSSVDFSDQIIDLQSSFVERLIVNKKGYFLDNRAAYSFRVHEIKFSGKCISNGSTKELASSISTRFNSKTNYPITVVKSNLVTTFASEGTIYITSGLIAQVSNEDQIAFAIAREIECIENNLLDESQVLISSAYSYEEKIKILGIKSLALNTKLDSLALIRIKAMGIDESNATSFVGVLRLADLPFEDFAVPKGYLNTDKLSIPEFVFEIPPHIANATRKKSFANSAELKYRYDRLQKQTKTEAPKKSLEPLFASAQKEARLLYIEECILAKDFDNAIYSIYLWEKLYGSTTQSDYYKAHAWRGFALTKIDIYEELGKSYHLNGQSNNAAFFYFLKNLEPVAALSLAMRVIYDLQKKDATIEPVWSELLSIAHASNKIDFGAFKNITFEEYLNSFNNSIDTNKYATLLSDDTLKTQLDASNFHLYALSDLVNLNAFQMDSLSKRSFEFNKATIKLMPLVSIYKGRSFSKVKSEEKQLALLNEMRSSDNFKEVKDIAALTTQQTVAIKRLFNELYQLGDYEQTFPLLQPELLQSLDSEAEYMILPFFQSAFKPKIRGYHSLGLFVAPLPFVIPDFVLSSFQSVSVICLLNLKTGTVEKIEYQSFNSPLTKKTMHNRIYQFTLNL